MASNYKLSEGALQIIMNGGDVTEPTMQVLGSKKINSSNSEKDRYRIMLSDGKFNISFAMLTPQINDKVGIEAIQNYSVIKLKRYITSFINYAEKADTRILLILDMDLVARGEVVGRVIGTPVLLTDYENGETRNSHSVIKNGGVPNPLTRKGDELNQSLADAKIVSPISSLSPYHNNWVVKARISNKTNIRTWSNSRGEGKLFSFDLIDESGEIRCTAFRDMVDKFYDSLEVDKVYYVSKCQLKPINRQFCILKSEYEMTMTDDSIIEECIDNSAGIPQIKYDFISIDKVAAMEIGTLVDVIGVCKSASDLQVFTAKSSNRELKKKEVILVDQSKTAISLTLWGSQAEGFDGTDNPVVVVKGAKIGEFGGAKNLSTMMSTQLKFNPDLPQCYRLKSWYDLEGYQAEIKNISERTGIGNFQTPWMSFREVQEQGLGQSDRGDYFQNVATILLMRSENAVYKACPSQECNKKVIDLENGMYRCEKCNREYPNFKYRLLVSMNVGDSTSNQWVSMFSSEAEKVVGMTSQEVGLALETDSDAAVKIFEEVTFKQFVFKYRIKMETYNDEHRLKTVVVKADPINYEEYNSYLVEEIQKLIS